MTTFPSGSSSAALASFGFDGKVALVVGAGQSGDVPGTPIGNGRAISLELARRGAQVVCADRNLQSARRTLALIEEQGGRGHAIEADTTDPESASSLPRQAAALAGRLDALVLNAGISDRKPLEEVSAESWDAILRVNLRGHMLCSQSALPVLANDGAIVFISSVAAYLPMGRNPSYEVSKAGLRALCRAVALAGHERGIRANVVTAGLIDTPMGRDASRARPGRATGALPFGRQGSSAEIASAVCFLLSNDASYVNAAELVVDGGLSQGIALSPRPSA